MCFYSLNSNSLADECKRKETQLLFSPLLELNVVSAFGQQRTELLAEHLCQLYKIIIISFLENLEPASIKFIHDE